MKYRDDAIRKKADVELNRQKTPQRKPSSRSLRSQAEVGSVAGLRPSAALTVLETARISQVSQLMASKRADAVLVVNSEGLLSMS
jgi:hypothetical protein